MTFSKKNKKLVLSPSTEKCFLFLLKIKSSVCKAREEESARRMDGSPSTITFISHLLCSEDAASEPCQINWGLFSSKMQTEEEGDSCDFPYIIKAVFTFAGGIVSSFPPRYKWMRDLLRCSTAVLQHGSLVSPTNIQHATILNVLMKPFFLYIFFSCTDFYLALFFPVLICFIIHLEQPYLQCLCHFVWLKIWIHHDLRAKSSDFGEL